jgi:hypothetical protein
MQASAYCLQRYRKYVCGHAQCSANDQASEKPELPCHKELNPEAVGDLKQELNASMILAEQITTISKLQLRNYVGRVADADLLVAIDQTIREQLGLSGPDRHDNDHHSTKNKECDCNDHK